MSDPNNHPNLPRTHSIGSAANRPHSSRVCPACTPADKLRSALAGLCLCALPLAACSGGATDSDAAGESAQARPDATATTVTGEAAEAAPNAAMTQGSAMRTAPASAMSSAGSTAMAAMSSTSAAPANQNVAGAQAMSMTAAAGAQANADATGAAGAEAQTQPSAAGSQAMSAATAAALPPITDPGETGPFEIEVTDNLEGLSTHILIAPKDLGRDGIKHPIVVWINGAGTGSTGYREMLDNVAAHGFFLLDDKQSGFDSAPEVEAQRAAIDWAIEQAQKQGGPYFEKLDPSRIAIAGHSLGSVSTFGNAKDMRIKTSIHMAGGVTGNPEGVDESWLQDLHVPAAFFCGDRDTNGLPRCKNDFAAAPASVPLFFGMLAGVGHTDEFSNPNGGRWGRILVAWLRWQLADDAAFAASFEGSDCEFCKGDWTAMKHAID